MSDLGWSAIDDEDIIDKFTSAENAIMAELTLTPRGLRNHTLKQKVGISASFSEFRDGLQVLADKNYISWHRAPTAR